MRYFAGRWMPGVVFGALVIVLAMGNLVRIYPYGAAVWIRAVVGLVGITGAIDLFLGNGWWRVLLAGWCGCQSIVVATDVSGEWFYQGLRLGFSSMQSHTVKSNELVVEYSASGWSTTGVVLLLVLGVIVGFRLHPGVRRQRWVGRWVMMAPVAMVAVILGVAGWRAWRASTAMYVLDVDLPNVPIYYKDQLLGRTPLRVTAEKIAAWKLPVDASKRLEMFGWGWADCVVLSDGETSVPLYAGAPWPFEGDLDRFESPWGERCRMQIGGEAGNRRWGYLYPKPEMRHEPVLTIEVVDALPVAAGGALRVRCELANPTAKEFKGRVAAMERHCFSYEVRKNHPDVPPAGFRREVDMPAAWNVLPAGGKMTADLTFDAPAAAGDYELFCTWFLYAPEANSESGVGSVYSNMVWLKVK